MIKILKGAAVLAVALSAAQAYAQSPTSSRPDSGWGDQEWARLPVNRPGYENLNDCEPGLHGVPFPNGNGFRCVPNGW